MSCKILKSFHPMLFYINFQAFCAIIRIGVSLHVGVFKNSSFLWDFSLR